METSGIRLCLLKESGGRRGVIIAIAHVRGGGDLGQFWYQAGKLLQKNNTFADLVAVAELLIQVRSSACPRANLLILCALE